MDKASLALAIETPDHAISWLEVLIHSLPPTLSVDTGVVIAVLVALWLFRRELRG